MRFSLRLSSFVGTTPCGSPFTSLKMPANRMEPRPYRGIGLSPAASCRRGRRPSHSATGQRDCLVPSVRSELRTIEFEFSVARNAQWQQPQCLDAIVRRVECAEAGDPPHQCDRHEGEGDQELYALDCGRQTRDSAATSGVVNANSVDVGAIRKHWALLHLPRWDNQTWVMS